MPARLAAPLLAVLALLLALIGAGEMSLKGCDECFYAEIAREMRITGDWLTPRYLGEPAFDKPPLLYWLVAASTALCGEAAFAARLPVMACGLLAVGLAAAIARRDRDDVRSGFWAGALVTTSVVFAIGSHLVMTDVPALAALAALWLGVRGLDCDARWGWLVGPALGALVLAKGALAGLVLLAIAPYWLWRRPRMGMPFWAGLAVGLAPAAAWYGAMHALHGTTFWASHVGVHVVERAGSGLFRADPLGPAYYLVNGAWLFLPWTFLLISAVAAGVRRARAGDAPSVLALSFAAVFLLAISLAATKFHHYALPLVLPLALLGADWLRLPGRSRLAGGLYAGLGALLIVAAGLVAAGVVALGPTPALPPAAAGALLGAGWLAAGTWFWRGASRALAGGAIVIGLVAGLAVAAPALRPWDAAPGLDAVTAPVPPGARVVYVTHGDMRAEFCTIAALRYRLAAPLATTAPGAAPAEAWRIGRHDVLVPGPGDRVAAEASGWRLVAPAAGP